MYKKQRDLLFKLTICRGIGNFGLLKLLDFSLHHKIPEFTKEEIIRIAQITKHKNLFITSWDYWSNHPEKLSSYQKAHRFITILDPEYPFLLKQIYNCPAILFYHGNLTYLQTLSLAINMCDRSTQKSGSLITAQSALEYNREVFAVPDNVKHQLSEGCNKLIQEGAKCLTTAHDTMEELQFF